MNHPVGGLCLVSSDLLIEGTGTSHRNKLPQPYASLFEDCCGLSVHAITLAVDNLADAHLRDFYAASQAWTSIAVKYGALPNTFPASFQQRILLSVDAKARSQANTGALPLVTSWAASFATVSESSRCAVVSRADNPLLSDQNTTHASLHTVASLCSQ